jgi:hypothetical protein
MELYSSSELSGTPLDAIEPFTEELTGIVAEMQEKLGSETKLLEGTETLTREDIRIPLPDDPARILAILKNELSDGKTNEEEWKSPSQSGCWTTDPTPTFTLESSSTACIAELFSQDSPIPRSNAASSDMWTGSCEEMRGDCGCETDATNGPCACMEQTISVPMVGTPSEEK